MNESHGPDVTWEQVAPHLDAALGELGEMDRDALFLRYFEGKSAHEIAQALAVSDEAAQKRVSRAVERLRAFFAKRGVTVGASGLAIVISANAVQSAPIGLAAALCATSLASATSGSGALTFLKFITMSKLIIPTAPPTACVSFEIISRHSEGRWLGC